MHKRSFHCLDVQCVLVVPMTPRLSRDPSSSITMVPGTTSVTLASMMSLPSEFLCLSLSVCLRVCVCVCVCVCVYARAPRSAI